MLGIFVGIFLGMIWGAYSFKKIIEQCKTFNELKIRMNVKGEN
jgi:hypothetical protein